MKVQDISNLLDHHPYYNKLDRYQKIIVLNIALTKYYEKTEDEIHHAIYPDGYVGFDGTVFEPDTIQEIPQMMLSTKSLSQYTKVDIDLSTDEYLKNFTESERILLYQIALSKISFQIPEEYTIENMINDIRYSAIAGEEKTLFAEFKVIEVDKREYINSLIDLEIDYYFWSRFDNIAYLSNIETSYSFVPYNAFTNYLNDLIVEYSMKPTSELTATIDFLEATYAQKDTILSPDDTDEFTAQIPVLETTYTFISN